MKRVKATLKQRKAFKGMIESTKPLGDIMIEAGYAQSASRNPKENLFESKGFIALCDDMGLTDEFLNSALKEDIEKKVGSRAAELTLGYKIRGRLKDDAQVQNFTPATINIAIISKPQERIEEKSG